MPKARSSSPRRRMIRFLQKYTHTVIPLRVKVQLSRMDEALGRQLTILDELEKQVYEYLETVTD